MKWADGVRVNVLAEIIGDAKEHRVIFGFSCVVQFCVLRPVELKNKRGQSVCKKNKVGRNRGIVDGWSVKKRGQRGRWLKIGICNKESLRQKRNKKKKQSLGRLEEEESLKEEYD
ncbi:hypothetical protein SUGI_1006350 [Cryptomeria japonica]|nr:hypothetical protein SUGI_1006350 [Cryptomeria japonica]